MRAILLTACLLSASSAASAQEIEGRCVEAYCPEHGKVPCDHAHGATAPATTPSPESIRVIRGEIVDRSVIVCNLDPTDELPGYCAGTIVVKSTDGSRALLSVTHRVAIEGADGRKPTVMPAKGTHVRATYRRLDGANQVTSLLILD